MNLKPTTTTSSEEAKLAVIETTMTRMGQDLGEMKQDLKDLKGVYPTKEEVQAKIDALDKKYELSRTLIYGFCTLALVAVVVGLLALVVSK